MGLMVWTDYDGDGVLKAPKLAYREAFCGRCDMFCCIAVLAEVVKEFRLNLFLSLGIGSGWDGMSCRIRLYSILYFRKSSADSWKKKSSGESKDSN